MKRYTFYNKLLFFALVLVVTFVNPPVTQAQDLDATARTHAVKSILSCLQENYIYPEVATKMEKDILSRAAKGEYNNITDGNLFAQRLTRDLQAICHDLHVNVSYSAQVLPPEPKHMTLSPQEAEHMRQMLAKENFGVAKVEILKGNLGYIKFNLLAPPDLAAEVYASTMTYVSNTDALIIDLRECGGSISPDAIPMLCSYFFKDPVHLNDIYWRHENKTRQFWSWAYVPGKRYLDKPIYVLTSRRTFSGAEELAYDLKNLKRATIIGDTTGGGANPGGTRRANDHFMVWVPFGKVTNPITKTNWEGTGVTPDIPVPASAALNTAQITALTEILNPKNDLADGAAASKATGTMDEQWKNIVATELANLEKTKPQFKEITFTLKGYEKAKEVMVAGSFNYWTPRTHKLIRKGDTWQVQVPLETGNHSYKFVVDGEWITDPANPQKEANGNYTNSVLTVK
jgi:hypothetical protein